MVNVVEFIPPVLEGQIPGHQVPVWDGRDLEVNREGNKKKIMSQKLLSSRFERITELCKGEVPRLILNRIRQYKSLDTEFVNQTYQREEGDTSVFSISRFKNTEWKGFWLRATGNDELLYMCYVITALSEEGNTTDKILKEYIKYHNKEKFIPNSVIDAVNDVWLFKSNDLPY